jgi:lysophospholipase L1-like esterase
MGQALYHARVRTVTVRLLSLTAVASMTLGAACSGDGAGGGAIESWVGTWACGPQLTETSNLPPAPGLAENTLRQFVYVSIGGSKLRVRLSNEFGDGPVTMRSVHIAAATTGDGVDVATDQALRFSGAAEVTIPAGEAVWSDPFDFALAPLTRVGISIALGAVPAGITGHPGSRTTSYLVAGDAMSSATLAGAAATDHWYYITGIDVAADDTMGALVILGDSLTDGRGSTTNGNDRWPDALSRRLRADAATANVAVLNQGIGGNAVLSGGLGPTALQRFARDVLRQSGVRWLIVFEGVNDIGGATATSVAQNLINAYSQFIDMAHARGIRVYGAPLTPIAGSSYDTAAHEADRQTVNTWIRTIGPFDAVIDLDAAVSDPANPAALLPTYDSGDHLHLNPAGYQQLADTIDLALFTN